jgi:hypothetical protein
MVVMKFIGMENGYDIIEMSREELTDMVQLMKYVSERSLEQMPEPAVFDEHEDAKEVYADLLNAINQMDSDNPQTQPCPPEPSPDIVDSRGWTYLKCATVLAANKDSVTLAIGTLFYLHETPYHFRTFYNMMSEDEKKLVPDRKTLLELENSWHEMTCESLIALGLKTRGGE